MKNLDVFGKHQKAIALKTLKMSDVGANIMGGMTKEEAREFLKSIGYNDAQIRRLEASDKGVGMNVARELVAAARDVALAGVSLDTDDRQTDFLSPEMEKALNDQLAYEMYSAYLYFMVSAWADSKGLTGFCGWFKKQGDDEIGHAMKIFKYLMDTGSPVTLPPIDSPAAVATFKEMADATRAVLDHEMKVTKRWQTIGELSKGEANLATQELAQWFMTEQVEEEDGAVKLHQKVQLADSGAGLLIIDSELKG